jgi:hypothetical protein
LAKKNPVFLARALRVALGANVHARAGSMSAGPDDMADKFAAAAHQAWASGPVWAHS